MNTLKMAAIILLLIGSIFVNSASAERLERPDHIDPNDHIAWIKYYEGLAKATEKKLEAYEHELADCEDHPYTYIRRPFGIRTQDLSAYLRANIRQYSKELAEELEQAELHKRMSLIKHLH
ncbi:hypothetical protein [Nitrosomonas sp.]|uniref:hypothetical protein n=1 Tax=Nitrosomonas sp. TaxID=42353 RepID=UPI001DAA1F33|nr:hypothetical protein [Nitrosomonas sp.]MCB1949482.1 hypothetical protein [Nitrosomonas sp.]MCP5244318.1 hypothetical protein [Burkholderiales bacterium]MDR4515633.1 hypothetical protein [Nitrosomonas sp.]